MKSEIQLYHFDEVFRSGNYQYSIARNVNDLDRLNTNVFKKTQKLKNLLHEYSKNNFGFIACIHIFVFQIFCSTLFLSFLSI